YDDALISTDSPSDPNDPDRLNDNLAMNKNRTKKEARQQKRQNKKERREMKRNYRKIIKNRKND
ncbi:MAG: hypothetical protein AAF573_17415, partial [Bacteroidota bacterium]